MTDLTDSQIVEIIKNRLTPKRFNHSLAVAEEAKRLARKYGEDEDRLFTAGLLHDAMKDSSPEEQLKYRKERKEALARDKRRGVRKARRRH